MDILLPEISRFVKQMEYMGFPVTDAKEGKDIGPSLIPRRRYTLYRTDFKVGGMPAWIGEKYKGVHRLEYNGPIPDFESGGLTKKTVRLVAYEHIDGEWTRADQYAFIDFP